MTEYLNDMKQKKIGWEGFMPLSFLVSLVFPKKWWRLGRSPGGIYGGGFGTICDRFWREDWSPIIGLVYGTILTGNPHLFNGKNLVSGEDFPNKTNPIISAIV